MVPVKHRERFQLKRGNVRFTVGIWKGQGKVRNELVIAFGARTNTRIRRDADKEYPEKDPRLHKGRVTGEGEGDEEGDG